MKARNLTYLGGLAAIAVAAVMLSQHMDVDVMTDTLAETDPSGMTVTCNGGTEPTITAWVPNIALALTTPSAVSSAPTNSVAITLGSGTTINAETTTVSTITNSAVSNGRIFNVSHNAPKMKLTGMQCHIENTSKLQAVGTNTAGNYDLYASDFADLYSGASNQIDGTSSVVLFGTSGVIETSNVTDGSGTVPDDSTNANGEVLIGSLSGTDANGDNLWRLNHKLTFLDVATADYNTQSETVVFGFTAQ